MFHYHIIHKMDPEWMQRFQRHKNEPHYPQFVTQEEREKTFIDMNWSLQIKPNYKELAEAGFFYSGSSDGTVCFNCGKGLHQWKETDNAFVEHVKHLPACSFLQASKGYEFVKEIKKMLRKPQPLEEVIQDVYSDEPPLIEITPGKECLVCISKERQIAFQPCGHFVTCIACSYSVKTCCICRSFIINRMRIFSS
jgi:baculoviral IAP repeat-containing protein 7/8